MIDKEKNGYLLVTDILHAVQWHGLNYFQIQMAPKYDLELGTGNQRKTTKS